MIDIYPTLVELCELPDRDWPYPAITTRGIGNHAVRSQRWRYIRYADGSEELYDHDNDEMEWENLAGNSTLDGVMEDLAEWLPEHDAEDCEVVEWPDDDLKYRERIAAMLAENEN